ncbi:MAG: aminotransferase class IV [Phycisphaerales bacterium]
MIVHLNGQLVPRAEARIDPFDRGFLFGDGLYEGLRAFDSTIYGLDLHAARLRAALRESRISGFDADALGELSADLLGANGLTDAFVYWQITRGAPAEDAPTADLRKRVAGAEIEHPTVFGYCVPLPGVDACVAPKEVHATTVEDTRWTRCHIKSVSLMGNVLHALESTEAGAHDAIMLRGGHAVEASSTNLFVVKGDRVATPPVDRGFNLRGVTRDKLLRLALEIEVRDIPAAELADADEILLAGTITMVASVTRLDGAPVGQGAIGPIARRMYDRLVGDIRTECAADANYTSTA